MKKLVKRFIAAALFSAPVIVTAGTITCGGTIDMVVVHQPGFVGVKLTSMNDYAFVCRIDADYTPAGAATITPTVCKALYAGLVTAKVNKLNVTNLWFDGDAVPSSCTTWAGGAVSSIKCITGLMNRIGLQL